MDEAAVAAGSLVISCREATSIFEFVEAAFDDVAQCVGCAIDWNLNKPVFLGWDHGKSATLSHVIANEISVIAFVGQQHFGCRAFCLHDGQIALVVRDLASRESNRYGKAQRIDAEMDFGRKATF